MNWVSIDKAKCNSCGLCILRCPRVYSKVDGEIVAQADSSNCNACGHCISLCKSQAIVHSEMDMNNFSVVNEEVNFETGKFIQFIRSRRSHRHFKNKAIPRTDLETLIDACRYAPTGGNAQSVEIIVLENQDKIKRLSDYTIDFFINTGDQVSQLIGQLVAEGKDVPEMLVRARQYGERFKLARQEGQDPIFHKAPVIMVFHASQDLGSPKDDCVIASTTMSLLARTMGIESTYIGLLVGAARGNQEIHSELNIPTGNEIFSVLIMGYPRLKYLYAVDRKPIRVRWER
jgi:nitroreductase/NAD-dependent dihydropyrimidine dehydrogenase PreA subunit